MARLWIGLAAALWLETSVASAGEPGKGERRLLHKPAASAAAPRRPAPALVVPARDGRPRHARVVVRLRSVPASDLAATIDKVFRGGRPTAPADAARSVVIVPDAVSNSLLVGGPPDAVDEVRRLVPYSAT